MDNNIDLVEALKYISPAALDYQQWVNIGMALKLEGYSVRFLAVNCSDDIITEGLARAAMNYAANRNAYIALISRELSSEAFERLGFKGDEILSVEIPEALASGCSCGNSKQ